MNIREIDGLWQQSLPDSKKVDRNHEFKEIFDRRLSEVSATGASSPHGLKREILNHGGKVLNLLDIYARNLGDGSKTLRDIEPMVRSIERETGVLRAKTAEQQGGDKELEKLMDEVSTAANVAVLKFHRGDYV
jgi:hypothetical protein